MMKHVKRHLTPVLCIVGMVLISNLQLVLNLSTHFVGRPFEDAVSVIWEFWWANKAITDKGAQILFTPNVYYPYGYRMASDAQPIWGMVFFAPLTRLLGPVVAYNIALLSTLVIGGTGVYILVESLTGRRLAGIVAVPVYIFAPVVTIRLGGHLNILLAMQWLPYLVLFAYHALTDCGTSSWISCMLVAFFYFLSSINSWYFAFVGFVPVSSAFLFSTYHSIPRRFQKLAISLACWTLLMSPFVVLTMKANKAMFGEAAEFAVSGSDSSSVSIDRLFAPNPLNPIWEALLPQRPSIAGEKSVVSLGYASLFLAILGMWKGQQEFKRASTVLLLVSIVLAMGTTLHWNDQRVLLELPFRLEKVYKCLTSWLTSAVTNRSVIPLPGLLLAKLVPFYAMMRAWCRFMIAGMLGLAVLAGYGVAFIQSTFKYNRLLLLVVVCAILAEGTIAPYKYFTSISTIERPVDYWLAQQPAGTAIIEYPWPHRNKNALYSQTIHGQPIVNGYAPHVPQYLRRSPEVMNTWPDKASIQTLRDWNVRYVLVTGPNTRSFEEEQLSKLKALTDLLWVRAFPVVGENKSVHVFEIIK